MRILYIGPKIKKTKGGADQVNLRNQRLLEIISRGNVDYITGRSSGYLNKLRFGVDNYMVEHTLKMISQKQYDFVFISQSLLGRITKKIKQKFPEQRIISFFHNIEVQYAQEYYKTIGFKALPFYFCTRYWERQLCQHTDFFITLNGRDSQLLKRIYGKSADIELPTSFEDEYDELKCKTTIASQPPIDYLFVGVAFFGNTQGVQWFIDNVMPHVDGHFHVIGKGMDQYQFKNLNDRIHIHGFVDDLSEYYYRARIVVSPIFVGGGMKTKTAEALMFGKTIIGTKEAFEGYVIDNHCMTECETAEDFVEAIKSCKIEGINDYARKLYVECYSNSSALDKLRTLL